jgi:mannitol-1-phosphate 5-dehydrogenase
MTRTFVGFGFGAIQAGLFLAEAHLSRNFDRLVVAEVLPHVVTAVRAAGVYTVNIGHADRIEALAVGPLEIYNPAVTPDREALVAAVAAASELATALPSVDYYARGANESVAAILAAGLRRKAEQQGPLAVVYTAENHTEAAHRLKAAVLALVPGPEQAQVMSRVQFLDTIIGKMSGAPEAQTKSAPDAPGLAPIAPGLDRAFLVEAFNRILIDQVARPGMVGARHLDPTWAAYQRGIEVFVEKAELQPFAQAKLYGHNAGHALSAYLAYKLGLNRIDELAARPDVLQFVREAMLLESGVPLRRRYADADPMFSPAGFRAYVDDLLVRMMNPYVQDTVARVGRDPARKLGWNDRLIGALRLAAGEIGDESRGVVARQRPFRYAVGAAAALDWLSVPLADRPQYLRELWAVDQPDVSEAQQMTEEIVRASARLQIWSAEGFPPLETVEMHHE